MRHPTRFRCALSGGIIYEGDQLYTTLYQDRTGYNEIRLAGGLQKAEAVDEFGIGLNGKHLNLYKRCGIGLEDGYIGAADVFSTVYCLSPKESSYGKAQLAIVKKSATDIIFEKEMSKYNVFIDEMYDGICAAWSKYFEKERNSEYDKIESMNSLGLFYEDLGIKRSYNYVLHRCDILGSIYWHFGMATQLFHLETLDLIESYPPEPPSIDEIRMMVLAELVRDYFSRIARFHSYAYLSNKGVRDNSELSRKLRLTIKALGV